ncbi:MAG: hypothetical protein V5A66_03075 [Candidatus Thermoplasmatota archaeon]
MKKNIEITQENGAFFDVEIIEYTEEVKLGDEVSIEYSCTNTGDVEETQDLIISIDGDEANRDEDVTIPAGETWDNNYTYDTDDIDVSFFFLEFSTDLSLILDSKNDSHSGTITVTQPVLDILGFNVVLLPISLIFAVLVYQERRR